MSINLYALYDLAAELGEVLSLNFWIHKDGYGPNNRACGEVLIWNNGVTVCHLPYGVEHEHQPCAYCPRVYTHVGEGETVCENHIKPEAAGEYLSILDDSARYPLEFSTKTRSIRELIEECHQRGQFRFDKKEVLDLTREEILLDLKLTFGSGIEFGYRPESDVITGAWRTTDGTDVTTEELITELATRVDKNPRDYLPDFDEQPCQHYTPKEPG